MWPDKKRKYLLFTFAFLKPIDIFDAFLSGVADRCSFEHLTTEFNQTYWLDFTIFLKRFILMDLKKVQDATFE